MKNQRLPHCYLVWNIIWILIKQSASLSSCMTTITKWQTLLIFLLLPWSNADDVTKSSPCRGKHPSLDHICQSGKWAILVAHSLLDPLLVLLSSLSVDLSYDCAEELIPPRTLHRSLRTRALEAPGCKKHVQGDTSLGHEKTWWWLGFDVLY